jgi:hypothetical protein
MSVVSLSMFLSSIKTNLASMLRTMEDQKKGMLCLDRLTFELEEERNLTIVIKPINFTKKLNLN